MPGVRHDREASGRPSGGKLEGGGRRADHVVAALHDLRRDVTDPTHPAKQSSCRQEQAVGEIVCLDPGQAERVRSWAKEATVSGLGSKVLQEPS